MFGEETPASKRAHKAVQRLGHNDAWGEGLASRWASSAAGEGEAPAGAPGAFADAPSTDSKLAGAAAAPTDNEDAAATAASGTGGGGPQRHFPLDHAHHLRRRGHRRRRL